MNPRIFSSLFFLFFLVFSVQAQNETDVLRYSQFDYGSTARSMGVGSSLSALGADFSVLSSNPAGLAWYRKPDFVFTPGFSSINTEALLTNDKSGGFFNESKTPFHLSNFGVVFASSPRSNNWRTFNFGLGFNRLSNFNRKVFFSGRSTGSITDRFLELGNSSDELDGFESGPAFDAGALICCDADDFYVTDFLSNPDAEVPKQQTITRGGSVNELVFSFAGNYNERLMIGATLGVPFVSFTEEKIYREADGGGGDDGDIPFFDELEYREDLTTTGTGINFKLGIIARPLQMLRLGLAIHSPTAYKLEDTFNTEMFYTYTENGAQNTGNGLSPDGLFDYKINTPWRFIGSGGVIINKAGFLSGEVEYVDYGSATLGFSGFPDDERVANDSIQAKLGSAMNFKIGGEIAYEIFRFRAGFGLYQSPLIGDDITNSAFSLGAGMREESFYLDIAYRRQSIKEAYAPYVTTDYGSQVVETNTAFNQILFTLGFRF